MSQQIVILKDNSHDPLQEYEEYNTLLKEYSHHSLGKLLNEHNNLVVFSPKLEDKDFYRLNLWDIRDNCIHTNNLMGFIGLKDRETLYGENKLSIY